MQLRNGSLLMSEEEFLQTSFDPEVDFVNGEIWERGMGSKDHASWQLAIAMWFQNHSREWGIKVYPELTIKVNKDGDYLIADVAVLDKSDDSEKYPTKPPIAVFEVRSPDQAMDKHYKKFKLYAEMGVENIWFVDPEDEIFKRWMNDELQPHLAFRYPAFDNNKQPRILFQLHKIKDLLQ
jgi:Uma2 family endonuclease